VNFAGLNMTRVILILVLPFVIWASTDSLKKNSGINLEEVSDFYKSIDQLEVGFHQEIKLKDMKSPIKLVGILKVSQPNQIRWEILKPSHLLVNLNEKEIIVENGEGESKTVQVFKRGDMTLNKENKALESMVGWIKMDLNALKKDYGVTQFAVNEFLFVPYSKESSFFQKLKMKVTKNKNIEKITLFEKSGDLIEITFGKPKIKIKND
jgi:outer membrane lipoprotein-sorting protein